MLRCSRYSKDNPNVSGKESLKGIGWGGTNGSRRDPRSGSIDPNSIWCGIGGPQSIGCTGGIIGGIGPGPDIGSLILPGIGGPMSPGASFPGCLSVVPPITWPCASREALVS